MYDTLPISCTAYGRAVERKILASEIWQLLMVVLGFFIVALPDGLEIRWSSARMRQDGMLLPFLIEDLTPRELRVPGGPAAEHPNGATDVARLGIAAADVEGAAASLAKLVETSTDASVRLGACALSPVATEKEDAAVPGPLAVELVGEERESQELDPLLAHGASILLRSPEG